jgi:hypothetical protein
MGDNCRFVIDPLADPLNLVICAIDGSINFLQSKIDNNYAHIMKNQDFITLPYLVDKIRIPIYYLN